MFPIRSTLAGWSPDFRRLAIAAAAVGVFFGVQLAIQHNFIVEVLGIEPDELGYVGALREVPGFFNFVFLAVMIALSPPVAAAICLVFMGVGMAAFSQVNTVVMFTVFSVVWSIGFHAWHPLSQSMGLIFSGEHGKGKALGQLRSVESFAWLLMIIVCMVSFKYVGYSGLFIIAGRPVLH